MKKQYLILMVLVASVKGFAINEPCVKELASAPYCLNIATAEMNCKITIPNYLDDLKICIQEGLKLGRDQNTRELINDMCLTGSATSSDASKNKSLCKTQHIESNLNTSRTKTDGNT